MGPKCPILTLHTRGRGDKSGYLDLEVSTCPGYVRTFRIMTILLATVTEGFLTLLWQEVNHTNTQFKDDAPRALLSKTLGRRRASCWTSLPATTVSSPPDNPRRSLRRRGERAAPSHCCTEAVHNPRHLQQQQATLQQPHHTSDSLLSSCEDVVHVATAGQSDEAVTTLRQIIVTVPSSQ